MPTHVKRLNENAFEKCIPWCLRHLKHRFEGSNIKHDVVER